MSRLAYLMIVLPLVLHSFSGTILQTTRKRRKIGDIVGFGLVVKIYE